MQEAEKSLKKAYYKWRKASAGFGSPSGNMNLVMPSIHAPIQFANRLLYIKGLQPVNDIPLYLEAVKSSNNNVKLFTRGPTFYTPSGSMNLFIKQRDFAI